MSRITLLTQETFANLACERWADAFRGMAGRTVIKGGTELDGNERGDGRAA